MLNAMTTQGTQNVQWINREYPAGKNEKSKFTAEDDYELVYLRHRYIRRSPNPANARLEMFYPACKAIVKKISNRFEYVFKINGQGPEDLYNTSLVHIISYLGEFGLREHPEKLDAFVASFTKKEGREPTSTEVDEKDIRSFQSFLYQRLEEWGKVAATKNKNIRGTYSFTGYIMKEGKADEIDLTVLKTDFERFGYKMIKKKEYEDTLKLAGINKKAVNFEFEGKFFRKLYVSPDELKIEDVEGTFLEYNDSPYYSDPEDNLMRFSPQVVPTKKSKERSLPIEHMAEPENRIMRHLSEPSKVEMMKKFIEKNVTVEAMLSEVDLAIEYIRKVEPSYFPKKLKDLKELVKNSTTETKNVKNAIIALNFLWVGWDR